MPCRDHDAKKSPPNWRAFALWPQGFYPLEGRTHPNLPASASPPKYCHLASFAWSRRTIIHWGVAPNPRPGGRGAEAPLWPLAFIHWRGVPLQTFLRRLRLRNTVTGLLCVYSKKENRIAGRAFRAATTMEEPFHRSRGWVLPENNDFRAATTMEEPFHRSRGWVLPENNDFRAATTMEELILRGFRFCNNLYIKDFS